MSPDLVPFVFDDREVRTVMHDGEPWVHVGDLCVILDIQNPRDAIAKSTTEQGAPEDVSDRASKMPRNATILYRNRAPKDAASSHYRGFSNSKMVMPTGSDCGSERSTVSACSRSGLFRKLNP
jgi:prophage antirepressor-like protein